jgi:pimeloyl-ACP methyl ester carboxylesterase
MSGSGYAAVNGMELYWESHGSGGPPLVLVHGGYGLVSEFASLIPALAATRQVIGIELQGHGHTRDIDRPFSWDAFGDDIAALIAELGFEQADLLGYSLGAGAALRATVQHPGRVRRLALLAIPARRDGWFPEVRAVFDHMGRAGFDQLSRAPLYAAWREVAPDPDAFPALMDKTGELQRIEFDWADEIAAISSPTLLVFADADSIAPEHAAEFYGLLGGGHADSMLGPGPRTQNRLAILPGRTHYDLLLAPELPSILSGFFA